MLGDALERLYETAVALNRRNIIELVQDRPYAAMCDLGCDDGQWTSELARCSRSRTIVGVEIGAERAQIAHTRGIRVVVSDLTRGFPFTDGAFDLVHANQVIEHVSDVDHFLAEVKRVLRVGGVAVISTENGSSWHNVAAAAMGWQIFSLTNVSARSRSVGNPLALHRRGPLVPTSWTHKTIFNYRGLLDIVAAHGLTVLDAVGAGYHPLPAGLGRIDVRHSHFVTVKAVKVLSS
jgi:2-polyprenyl-3-methyl-5-hydroxy-6-metoxy-1,4-benzoquinol methylase